jgi:hypothetical protein
VKPTVKTLVSRLFGLRGRKRSVVLLTWANWILLGVSWGMSLRAYPKLPAGVALWLGLWKRTPVLVDKSLVFFFYPAVQLVVFLGLTVVARRVFFNREDGAELSNLKAEVMYLEAIFVNLLFIHFQTTLILVSYGLGRGVHLSYVAIILAVMVMLVPYYYIRRRVLHR